jgi:hypothetical protein
MPMTPTASARSKAFTYILAQEWTPPGPTSSASPKRYIVPERDRISYDNFDKAIQAANALFLKGESVVVLECRLSYMPVIANGVGADTPKARSATGADYENHIKETYPKGESE